MLFFAGFQPRSLVLPVLSAAAFGSPAFILNFCFGQGLGGRLPLPSLHSISIPGFNGKPIGIHLQGKLGGHQRIDAYALTTLFTFHSQAKWALCFLVLDQALLSSELASNIGIFSQDPGTGRRRRVCGGMATSAFLDFLYAVFRIGAEADVAAFRWLHLVGILSQFSPELLRFPVVPSRSSSRKLLQVFFQAFGL